jgi:hypothetical protein
MMVNPPKFQVLRTRRCLFNEYVPCFALTGNKESVKIKGSREIRFVLLDTKKFSFLVVRPWEVRNLSPINFTLHVLHHKLLFTAITEENHYQVMEDYLDLISLCAE